MFINCPFCKALVATDPATDQPPEHCPRCAAKLHGVTADVPVPSVFPAPGEGQAGVPALDPNFLLQIPAADDPPVRGAGDATPSELSSQIRQTVALETPAPAPTDRAAIAPIAAMLKPSGAAAPAAAPDDAGREAEPAGPAPTPAAVEAAPAGATQAAAPANAEQPLTDAGQAAAADAPDAGAATDTEDTVPAEAGSAADARIPAPAPATADAGAAAATAPAQTPVAAVPAAQPATRALPSFARRRAALGANGLHWKSAAAIAALALLLALQLLLADRDHLAADARWRPLLANVCGALGCTLPPWREPGAFALLARDVRPHPSKPDVLRVTATFRNDARWPQPWPRIRLTLSDINGNAVATRDFDAREYLGNAPGQSELRSGQSASIAMDVVESGSRSVAFDFDLL